MASDSASFHRCYGPEGTSPAMREWSQRIGVRLRFINRGNPVQNAFVEGIDGKLRDESA